MNNFILQSVVVAAGEASGDGIETAGGGAVDQYILQDGAGGASGSGGPTLFEQKPILDGSRVRSINSVWPVIFMPIP